MLWVHCLLGFWEVKGEGGQMGTSVKMEKDKKKTTLVPHVSLALT